jgi:hypothetical protein
MLTPDQIDKVHAMVAANPSLAPVYTTPPSIVLPVVCAVLATVVFFLSIEILRSKKLFITLLKKQ